MPRRLAFEVSPRHSEVPPQAGAFVDRARLQATNVWPHRSAERAQAPKVGNVTSWGLLDYDHPEKTAAAEADVARRQFDTVLAMRPRMYLATIDKLERIYGKR